MRKFFTAKDILEANDIKVIEMEIPEWGEGYVLRLRSLSAGQVRRFTEMKGDNARNAMLHAFVSSAIDENGDQIFSTKDIPALEKKSIAVLNRIQNAIMKLNGIGQPRDPNQNPEDNEYTLEAASKG